MNKVEINLDIDVQTIKYNGKNYKISVEEIGDRYCICGCGKKATGKYSKYYSGACKTRVYRRNKLLKAQQNIK